MACLSSTLLVAVLLSCFIATMGVEHFMWACRKCDGTPSQPPPTGKIARLLHSRGLEKYDVPADGSCLFHAYARAVVQLINSGSKVNANIEDLTVEKLRQLVHNSASDFSLQHVCCILSMWKPQQRACMGRTVFVRKTWSWSNQKICCKCSVLGGAPGWG